MYIGDINGLYGIMGPLLDYTQRRVQPDQCYFIVQITGSNF